MGPGQWGDGLAPGNLMWNRPQLPPTPCPQATGPARHLSHSDGDGGGDIQRTVSRGSEKGSCAQDGAVGLKGWLRGWSAPPRA